MDPEHEGDLMYIGMRWATSTDPAATAAMVSGAAAKLRDDFGWNAVAAASLTGTSGRFGVLSLHDSLSQLLDRRSAVAADPGFGQLLSEAASHTVAGSGTDFVMRVIHGDPGGGEGDLLFFRGVYAQPGHIQDLAAAAVEIAEHSSSVHGVNATVSTGVGGDGEGILYAVRMQSGDDLEAFSDAAAADELMTKMMTDSAQHSAGMQDRIIRIMP